MEPHVRMGMPVMERRHASLDPVRQVPHSFVTIALFAPMILATQVPVV
jgi:hypothetical protein